MNRRLKWRTGVATLRPWPFGPPLRGRAPRRDAGPRDAPAQGATPRHHPHPAGRTRRQALAPLGGLAWPQQLCPVR